MIKLMILGAGIYQVPLIKKAQEMGYKTIVVSPPGEYPGIKIADIYVSLDTRDKEGILKKAIEHAIDGILTTGTDVAVPSIGYVIDKLGLSGTPYPASCRSMDKALMKDAFRRHGVITAKYFVVRTYEELAAAAKKIGYPSIVKAVDSSGSRGITKVSLPNDLEQAFENAVSVSLSKNIIIEEFIEGHEIGAQAVIVDSELKELFLHGDVVTPPPVSVPIGHSLPLNLSDSINRRIRDNVTRAIGALGIKNTVSNIDIMISDGEPYILEIGARMGATCLPENVGIYSGINMYQLIIELSLGKSPSLPSSYEEIANASELICSKKTGVVTSINIPDTTSNHPDLIDLSIDVRPGMQVNKFSIGPDRVGHIIVKGLSESKAKKLAHKLSNSIQIDVNES